MKLFDLYLQIFFFLIRNSRYQFLGIIEIIKIPTIKHWHYYSVCYNAYNFYLHLFIN